MTKTLIILVSVLILLAACSAPLPKQNVAVAIMGTRSPVSGVWCMNAFNGDLPSGATGATLTYSWAELNPARNVYTFGSLDYQIEAHALNGHPVMLTVIVSRGGTYGNYIYLDGSPAWVAKTRLVPAGTKTLRLTAYDDAAWRTALQTFVAVLGARYDKDVRLSAYTVGLGVDGESHPYESEYESYVVATLGTAYKTAFNAYCKSSLSWHHSAFPTLPLFCANNPGGQALRKDMIKNRLLPLNIGIRNCGLQIDDPTAYGPATYETTGGSYCIWCPVRDMQGKLQINLESTTGLATAESVAWSLWFAMNQRPTFIDLHEEWFPLNPSAISWAQSYFSDPARGAWIVFRDKEYPAFAPNVPESSIYYLSGWPGDFTYGVNRTTGVALRLFRASLPIECRTQIESRQARQYTDMTLQIASPAWFLSRIKIRVSYLNTTVPIQIIVSGQKLQFGGTGTNLFTWFERDITVSQPWDGAILFQGTGVLHMVEVLKSSSIPEQVTPTQTTTPPFTSTPTITRTPTPTYTPTRPIVTLTPSPTCALYLYLSESQRLSIRNKAGVGLYSGVKDTLAWDEDITLIRGNDEKLGAPVSELWYTEDHLTCRAFALGIIVVDENDMRPDCKNWSILLWNAETRN